MSELTICHRAQIRTFQAHSGVVWCCSELVSARFLSMAAKPCVNTGELLLANRHIASDVFNSRFLNHSLHNGSKDAYDSNI